MAKRGKPRLLPVGDADEAAVIFEPGESQSASTGDSGGQLTRGSRAMKEYYILDSEFRELKRTGAIATVLFAAGSACAGFVLNVHLGMAFAEKIPDALRSEYVGYKTTALILAVVFYFFAVLTSLLGYNRIEAIKAETAHGQEKYAPKPWYKIGIWALIFLALITIGYVIRSLR